jgi:hypothetical protein
MSSWRPAFLDRDGVQNRAIGAGRAAGCRTIFVDRGHSERLIDPPDFAAKPDFTAKDVAEAASVVSGRLAQGMPA